MKSKILSLVERYLGRGHFSGEENISVPCPFHKTKDGAPFSINVTNGLWQCFSCHVSGPLHKLLHGLGLPRHIIDAELKDIKGELEENRKRYLRRKRTQWVTKDPFQAETILPESILKPYEWCPMNLVNAGFSPQWLQWLDIGFDRANNRVMYPIRDIYGNLAGFSGGAAIAGMQPKYKVYQGPRTDPMTGEHIVSDFGPWFDEQFPDYKFHNHHYLWNFDQVYPRIFFSKEEQTLIITEGFKACIWLLQHGWLNTIALMGSSMSDQQRNLIHRVAAKVILFLDNDDAGRKATVDIARQLRQVSTGVKIALYPPDARQPDDLTPEELVAAIQGSETYPQWKRRYPNVHGKSKKGRPEHQPR